MYMLDTHICLGNDIHMYLYDTHTQGHGYDIRYMDMVLRGQGYTHSGR